MNIYMMDNFKSPAQKTGSVMYILEAITSHGAATVTKKLDFEGESENRANLKALIEAINRINTPCEVNLYTTSNYIIQGLMIWSEKWKRNEWTNGKGGEIKNVDLWREAIIKKDTKQLDMKASTRRHSYSAWMERELK